MKNKLYIERPKNDILLRVYLVLELNTSNHHKIFSKIPSSIKYTPYKKTEKSGTKTGIRIHFSYEVLSTLFREVDFSKFEISDEVLEINKEYEFFISNKEQYQPRIDYIDGKFTLVNIVQHCQDMFYEKFGKITENNVHLAVQELKQYGYFVDYEEVSKLSNLSNKVISAQSSRVDIDPEQFSFKKLATMLTELNQFPLVFIVNENNSLNEIREIHSHLSDKKTVVFFRPEDKDPDYQIEFKDFVHSNSLNSYIDETTDIVFISKNKIPKPLLKSNFKPKSVVMLSKHDYGKLSAYINNFRMVYYYNSSLVKSRVTGGKIINVL